MFLDASPIGNVTVDNDQFVDFAPFVTNHAGRRLQHPPCAIAVTHPILQGFAHAGLPGLRSYRRAVHADCVPDPDRVHVDHDLGSLEGIKPSWFNETNAAAPRTVKIKLTAAGLRFLKGAKTHKLAVVLDATVRGENSSSKNTTIRAAASAKKKK